MNALDEEKRQAPIAWYLKSRWVETLWSDAFMNGKPTRHAISKTWLVMSDANNALRDDRLFLADERCVYEYDGREIVGHEEVGGAPMWAVWRLLRRGDAA